MAWTRQTAAEVDALFTGLRARDPFGHRLHLAAAAAACFFAGFPTTWLEWAWWPVLLVCVVRLLTHHRILGPLVWEWAVWLTIAWIAWGALSMSWTAGTREAWLAEWGVARYALLMLALWPVMNERRWLIAALAAGVVMGNVSQVGHAVGRAAGVEWLVWPRLEERNSGWWDPVVGGTILCAALGLHLGGLVLGRCARERVTGGVMCAATLAAIAATGTRGAWLGAAGVGAFACVVMGWRWVRCEKATDVRVSGTRFSGTRWVAGAVAALVCAGAVWFVAGETIAKRAEETRVELSRAMEGDYSTFTGARLAMWGWAGRAVLAHPIRGVGAGGYQAWVSGQMERGGRVEPVHGHAHSTVMHAAAVGGVVGAGLLLGLMGVSVWNGLRVHGLRVPGTECRPINGYDAGPGLAMAGLLCAGLFDSVQVNQQTAYWMWVLAALCMFRRPRDVVDARSERRPAPEFVGVGSGGDCV